MICCSLSSLRGFIRLELVQYRQSRLRQRSSRLGHMLVIDVGRGHHGKTREARQDVGSHTKVKPRYGAAPLRVSDCREV